MKLLFCPRCGDVKKLKVNRKRWCSCRSSWGAYGQCGERAFVGGDAIIIGLHNRDVAEGVNRGRAERTTLRAWMFEKDHPRVTQVTESNEPDEVTA